MWKKFGRQEGQALLRRLRWVWQIAWSTSPYLLMGFLATALLESLLPAAIALAGRGLINAIVEGVQQGASGNNDLLFWLVLGAVLATSNAVINNLGDYWQQCLQDELNQRVGLDILQHAAQLDLPLMERSETQDLIERTRRYGQGLVGQVISKLVTLLNLSIRFTTLIGILLWIEPLVVGWLGILALPLLILRWRLATQTYAMYQRRTLKYRWSNYYIRTLTDVRLLAEVKFFNLAPLFTDRFRRLNQEFIGEDRRLYRFNLWLNSSFAFIGAVGLYALFGRIAGRIFAGALTVGDVAIYTSSALQLQGTVQAVVQTVASLREQLLHLDDLQTFLAMQPTPSRPTLSLPSLVSSNDNGDAPYPQVANGNSPNNGTNRPASSGGRGMIEFDHVSFAYPNSNEPVLTNLSFQLAPGETVAVVGENGAGKSTLAMLLARLYAPTAGVIRVDGVDLQAIDAAIWQQQIGFVFQRFIPYEASVRENIAYGDWQHLLEQPAKIEGLAQLAHAEGLIERLPERYETMLGWQFGKRNLSGGQWQKLALARGLARTDARLLILDEPSASLDARAEYELFSRFRQAAAGRTTVLISHRFSTISMADRILVLHKGQLIEVGTHTDLLTRDSHYARLYQLHHQLIPTA